MKIVFPGSFRCPGLEYAIHLLWLSLLRVEKQGQCSTFWIKNDFWPVKLRILQCGEFRKNFKILKEPTKTQLMRYVSSHLDEISMRTTRITDLLYIRKARRVPPAETRLTVYRRLQFKYIKMTRRALCSLRVIWGAGGASWDPNQQKTNM